MKTNQADTAINVYRDPDMQIHFGVQAGQVLAILKLSPDPLTLSEIAREIERQFGAQLPDSTVSGRVNDLKEAGAVSDANPKRTCAVTGRTKKTWRFLRPLASGEGEQVDLFGRRN